VVARALKRETGARGLRASLAPVIERAAYDHFGQQGTASIRLVLEGEQVRAIAE
jgi:ATP-dependent Clp protease ATP-binding subunit ClpX